jgi:hypothetical protein
MKSGIWSPSKKMQKNACALNEKTMGGTKSNGILKGDMMQKTNLKSRPHILRVIKQYSS